MIPSLKIAIDEHGRVLLGDTRIENNDVLKHFFESLHFDSQFHLLSNYQGQPCLVEAFDAPWVILDLKISDQHIIGLNTYGLETTLNLQSSYFDFQDRMNGETTQNIPWVLTRSAQEKIFDAFDSYDDESFVLSGKTYHVQPAFQEPPAIENAEWWSKAYQEGRAGWDLQAPHPALIDMSPRLKLPKSRVLVMGCGEGHDAAYLAQEGHRVTAVDFSAEALSRARKKYGHLDIEFVQADIFKLPGHFARAFDFVLEHTLYCAVPPEKRSDLVQIWNRCLVPGGYFMGLFFAMEKRFGPPYGTREWEVREQLKKAYHILFWGRWQKSPGWREGLELFVLGQKKDL